MTAAKTPGPRSGATPGRAAPGPVRERSWLEVRWRQFRNAPRPVFRAVMASLSVAVVLGLLYLAYDVLLTRGVALPGGDLRSLFVLVFVVIVLVAGSVITYLIVPQPGRPGVRSPWSAALGFFAAVPIAYLTLVIATQVLKPLFV